MHIVHNRDMERLAGIHPKDKAKNFVVTRWMLMGLRYLKEVNSQTQTAWWLSDRVRA